MEDLTEKYQKITEDILAGTNPNIAVLPHIISPYINEPFIKNNIKQIERKILETNDCDIIVDMITAFAGHFDTKSAEIKVLNDGNTSQLASLIASNLQQLDNTAIAIKLLNSYSPTGGDCFFVDFMILNRYINLDIVEKTINDLIRKNMHYVSVGRDFLNRTHRNALNVQLALLDNPESTAARNITLFENYIAQGTKIEPLIAWAEAHNAIVDLVKRLNSSTQRYNSKLFDRKSGIRLQKLLIEDTGHPKIIILVNLLTFTMTYPDKTDHILTQTVLQENSYDDELRRLYDSSLCDVKLLQKYIVDKKRLTLLFDIIDSRYLDLNAFNIPLLQKLVEEYGTVNQLDIFSNLVLPNFNFKSFKFKFNNVLNKKIENPDFEKEYLIDEEQLEHYSFADYDDRPDAIKFVNYLTDKKDYFFLFKTHFHKIIRNVFINKYRRDKNKTYIDLYNESIKNDYNLVLKLDLRKDSFKDMKTVLFHTYYILPSISINFPHYVKLIEKFKDACELIHNEYVNPMIMDTAIKNPSFDINDETNQEFLHILHDKRKEDDTFKHTLNRAKEKNLINYDNFVKNTEIFDTIVEKFNNKQPLNLKRGTVEYNAIKQLHVDYAIVEDFNTIEEYTESAKPKNEKLYNFSLKLPNNLEFVVLKYLDPYAFRMGAMTDCCQRIGGAGEEAAIDSYINPLAGVLVLNYNDNLLAQSYFHYVPEENGLILDNVEVNDRNLKHLKIGTMELSAIYAMYAKLVKEKIPDLKYVKCGMGYNKLGNDLFEQVEMKEDPRHFEVDDAYSDFDEDKHLDLLKPNDSIKATELPKLAIRRGSGRILKTGFVRLLLFEKILYS
jgi:hypothetical protein